MRLKLNVVAVPNVTGIYGTSKTQFPKRMAFLHPTAATSFAAAQADLGAANMKVSDMFRTAEQSLQAMQEKSGVMPPGFSLHGYGIAIDIDVDHALKALKLTKPQLDERMRAHGWYCHRKDGKRGSEDWHYNHLGADAAEFLKASEKSTNTSAAGESKIKALYGDQLILEPAEVQECLKHLKLYLGDVDGQIGPRTRQSLMAFQRAWRLQPSGQVDGRTERTLAYVSADIASALVVG